MAGSTFEMQVQASPEMKAMFDQAERLIERVASMTPAQLAEMQTGKLFLEAHQRAERLAKLATALLAKLPKCIECEEERATCESMTSYEVFCGECGAPSDPGRPDWTEPLPYDDEADALERELAAQQAAVEAMKVEAEAARAAAPIELEPKAGG